MNATTTTAQPATLLPLTVKVTAALAAAALKTEQTVLDSNCVVWSYRLATAWVDVVISRRAGRIVRANMIAVEDGRGCVGGFIKFRGTARDNAAWLMAAIAA